MRMRPAEILITRIRDALKTIPGSAEVELTPNDDGTVTASNLTSAVVEHLGRVFVGVIPAIRGGAATLAATAWTTRELSQARVPDEPGPYVLSKTGTRLRKAGIQHLNTRTGTGYLWWPPEAMAEVARPLRPGNRTRGAARRGKR